MSAGRGPPPRRRGAAGARPRPAAGRDLPAAPAPADRPLSPPPGASSPEDPEGGSEDAGRDELVGRSIGGRYEILSLLGKGAMGAVYLAEHDRIGRRDAIKVLNRELSDDAAARARFNREARNASFINHPNVCTVYDFGETREGLPYIAMEYVEGETLTDVLEREGPLPPRRAVDLVAQVARALEAAHARDIVHRDLKPDNVMLTRDARGSEIVKVVDFGIAKAMVAEEDGRQDITRQGLVVGTPQYVSPEQVEGKDLDGRSDLYSLGIVLFRVLTGEIPFRGETWQEVMTKRLSEEPRTLSGAAPDRSFPTELQRAMSRVLRRDPEERYQDATAFREDLLRAVAGAGAEAPSGRGEGTSSPRAGEAGAGRAAPSGGSPDTVPATEVGARTGRPIREGVAQSASWRAAAVTAAAVVGIGGVAVVAWQFLDADDAAGTGTNPAPTERLASGDTEGPARPVAGSDSAGRTAESGTAGSDGTADGDGSPRPERQPETGGASGEAGGAPTGGSVGDAEASPLSPSEVESVLRRQFDALVLGGVPGPDRLRAIGDTGRTVWSMERLDDGRRAWAAHIVGIVQLERGDTVEALPWLERAVDLDPGNQGYRDQLEAVRGTRR